MALTQRLDLRQAQTLVMTPQLQQAIKLLQLSNVELAEFVEQEIAQNPLLEKDDGDERGDGPAEASDDRSAAPDQAADTVEFTTSESLAGQSDAPLDTEFDNVWTNSDVGDGTPESFANWSAKSGRFDDDGDFDPEGNLTRAVSLRDHLLEQIQVDLTDPADRLIAVHLLDMLDGAGWLAGDPEEVAQTLGCPPDRVETVLAALQRFDPPGVFARDLRECLALQLREKNRLDPAMQALLENLPLLATRNMPQLLKICGVDAEDLTEMIAEIRALNPKPATLFDHAVTEVVTPDILMRRNPQGGWTLELNPDTLPRVLVNQRYHAQVLGAARTKAERDYISERLQTASWLARSLHQRATTILKVATEIVRQQESFFIHGIQFLRPLVLRDIAEAIGMHESTVSRVTTNKFMSTPRGLFELKYFFTSAIAGSDGAMSHSAESVKYRIKALIDAEKPDDILSDDRLVDILRAEGIDIARRTVAKYREALRIASSVQRRREKAIAI